ncbi:hypothetical protein FHR71_003938 [Methylobacterium sp. RAS18]|nr:hypothetical protein [Methylobacterium sp. RAS18]
MADLFGVNQSAIAKHIKNIIETNELPDNEATHSKMELVQSEGGRQVSREVEHYSLDMILAVGYCVSSKKATDFRRWATTKLRRRTPIKSPAAASRAGQVESLETRWRAGIG